MSRCKTVPRVSILALTSITALLSGCNTTTSTPPKPPPTKTEIVSYSFSPASPATLKFGENVTATLSYTSVNTAGIRMWAQIDYDGPITQGTLSFCPSSVITEQEGVVERCFRVTDAFVDGVPAPLHADTIELSICDGFQNLVLYEEFVDVDYTWVP